MKMIQYNKLTIESAKPLSNWELAFNMSLIISDIELWAMINLMQIRMFEYSEVYAELEFATDYYPNSDLRIQFLN